MLLRTPSSLPSPLGHYSPPGSSNTEFRIYFSKKSATRYLFLSIKKVSAEHLMKFLEHLASKKISSAKRIFASRLSSDFRWKNPNVYKNFIKCSKRIRQANNRNRVTKDCSLTLETYTNDHKSGHEGPLIRGFSCSIRVISCMP